MNRQGYERGLFCKHGNLGVVIRDSSLLKYLSFHTYFKDTLSSVTVRKKSEIWHLSLLC